MIDRKAFFDTIRAGLFGGTLNDGQVHGITAILDAWEDREYSDLRWLAYILATVKWETASTFQPIEEYGRGRGHAYGEPDPVTRWAYYGRGLVQLTHKTNYQKMGIIIGVNLVAEPWRAGEMGIATLILFEGMKRGSFTGLSLKNFFNDDVTDWVEARRIVNGTDRAEEIAEIAKAFYIALGGIVTEPLPPVSTGPRDLAHGMTGADVHALQKALLAHDGNFGAQTSRALKAFQASEGLDPDGVVGLKTREALKL